MKLAPVALFLYNRPFHSKITISHLKRNFLAKKTQLYIFLDGPKNNFDIKKISEIKNLIKDIKGFKKVNFFFRSKNYGLSKSFIEGISYVLKYHERVIVLEDDNLTSKYFLKYMNDSLELYKNDNKVCSVSGYVYPVNFHKELKTFFIRGADTWGCGIWKRSWKYFEPNGTKLLRILKLKKLQYDFNLSESIDMINMLKDQIKNKNDSWTVRWAAINFINNFLTLYPTKSFVKNIGNEGSGTHALHSNMYDVKLINYYSNFKKIPIVENKISRELFIRFFYSFSRYKYFWRFIKILKRYKYFIKDNFLRN
jgi:hypothetical protein